MSFLWALIFRLLGLSHRTSRAEAFRRGGLHELAALEEDIAAFVAAGGTELNDEDRAYALDQIGFIDRVAFAHAPHACGRLLALAAQPLTLATLRARCAAARSVLSRPPRELRAPVGFAPSRAAPLCAAYSAAPFEPSG